MKEFTFENVAVSIDTEGKTFEVMGERIECLKLAVPKKMKRRYNKPFHYYVPEGSLYKIINEKHGLNKSVDFMDQLAKRISEPLNR